MSKSPRRKLKIGTIDDFHHFWYLLIWDRLSVFVLSRGASRDQKLLGVVSAHRRSDPVLPVFYRSVLPVAPAVSFNDGVSDLHRPARLQALHALHRLRLRRLDHLLHALPERAGPSPDGFPAERLFHLAGEEDLLPPTTNTNVIPSMHVIGSAALALACFDAPRLRAKKLHLVMLPARPSDQHVHGLCQAALDARRSCRDSRERAFVRPHLQAIPRNRLQQSA